MTDYTSATYFIELSNEVKRTQDSLIKIGRFSLNQGITILSLKFQPMVRAGPFLYLLTSPSYLADPQGLVNPMAHPPANVVNLIKLQ